MGIITVNHAFIYGRPSCEILFGNALNDLGYFFVDGIHVGYV